MLWGAWSACTGVRKEEDEVELLVAAASIPTHPSHPIPTHLTYPPHPTAHWHTAHPPPPKMGKAKKTRKYAVMKKQISPKDPRLYV